MTNLAQFFFVFVGVGAFVGGVVLAILGARGAPDGFEDQDGFHVGRTPDVVAPKSALPPRKTRR